MQHVSSQHITCTSRLNPDKITLLFKINVSPSMKTKTKNVTEHMVKDELDECYTTFLAFDAINKDLLQHPCSVCGCCDGTHFCSHSLGFLLFLRCIQICDTDFLKFEEAMPDNPISIQNTIILIENMISNENRIKAQRKRRLSELNT